MFGIPEKKQILGCDLMLYRSERKNKAMTTVPSTALFKRVYESLREGLALIIYIHDLYTA
jgi:hypothetical protein